MRSRLRDQRRGEPGLSVRSFEQQLMHRPAGEGSLRGQGVERFHAGGERPRGRSLQARESRGLVEGLELSVMAGNELHGLAIVCFLLG